MRIAPKQFRPLPFRQLDVGVRRTVEDVGRHLGTELSRLTTHQPVAQSDQVITDVDGGRGSELSVDRLVAVTILVVILDVIVNEAEVVAHLDRGGTGQRLHVVADDGLVGQQADKWAHALATRRVTVEAHVIADHRVQLASARILGPSDDAEDLSLGVCDEAVEVDAGQHANMILVASTFPNGLARASGARSR